MHLLSCSLLTVIIDLVCHCLIVLLAHQLIFVSLHSYFESINISQFSSFVLIGDFNINFNFLTLLTLLSVIFVMSCLLL